MHRFTSAPLRSSQQHLDSPAEAPRTEPSSAYIRCAADWALKPHRFVCRFLRDHIQMPGGKAVAWTAGPGLQHKTRSYKKNTNKGHPGTFADSDWSYDASAARVHIACACKVHMQDQTPTVGRSLVSGIQSSPLQAFTVATSTCACTCMCSLHQWCIACWL